MRIKNAATFDGDYGPLIPRLTDGRGIWGRGCFVSTVGINEAIIRRYVRYQGEQDTGQAQLEF